MIQLNDNLIDLFNKSGPYYSSYPTLNNWKTTSETEPFNYIDELKKYFRVS